MVGVGRKYSQIWKWVLMAVVALAGASVVGVTLRARPDLEASTAVDRFSNDAEFLEALRRLDAANLRQIADGDLEAAGPADSLAICRRLSLALVGSAMSLEEIRMLEAIDEDGRVAWWTNHLLAGPRWSEYFSQRIARACVGVNQGPFLLFRRRKFNSWLAEQLTEDVGFDKIVRQMIGSEGLWTDTPAVNFVTATMDEEQNGRADPVRLAGRTSRAFLAMRIDCLQCHDDVLQKTNFGSRDQPREGTQHDFHQLAAFYSGTSTGDAVFRGITEDQRSYEFEFLNAAEVETVAPAVPFYSELLPAQGKPRRRLAEWVTHPENKAFARATVNRTWALMFGRALVEPVDDIPLVGDLPPMLEVLADDLAKHDFNMRRLVALIAYSTPFQRSSRAEFDITPEHEQAWAIFPLVQLRPDQVASSITQACRLTVLDEESSIFTQLKAYADSQEFVQRFGDRGEDEFDSDPITISQRLLMMNGNMVTERTKAGPLTNAPSRIAILVSDDEEAIELLFLALLNRHPSDSERETFVTYLANKTQNARARAISDVAWAMLNTTEFSWNH